MSTWKELLIMMLSWDDVVLSFNTDQLNEYGVDGLYHEYEDGTLEVVLYPFEDIPEDWTPFYYVWVYMHEMTHVLFCTKIPDENRCNDEEFTDEFARELAKEYLKLVLPPVKT